MNPWGNIPKMCIQYETAIWKKNAYSWQEILKLIGDKLKMKFAPITCKYTFPPNMKRKRSDS